MHAASAATSRAGDIPALEVAGLTKTYTAVPVLREVSLTIHYGEVHALLGGNGSGKSTLIKILAGVVDADGGAVISLNGDAQSLDRWTPHEARRRHLRFIHQDLGLTPDLTVAENLFLDTRFQARGPLISWRRMLRIASETLHRFELDIEPSRLVRSLTLVEQTLLAVVRALHDVAEDARAVVVFDEPTAALPSHQAELLMAAIRRYADQGHAMLVVTHRLGEVVAVCDRMTVLREGVVVHASTLGDKTESDLGQLITGVDAGTEMRGGHGWLPSGDGDEGLRLDGVASASIEVISLEVRSREIVGLVDAGGQTGSSILRTIFGLEDVRGGSITLGGMPIPGGSPRSAMQRGVAYLPSQRLRDALLPGLSVAENILIASLADHQKAGLLSPRSERAAARSSVAEFQIWPTDAEAEVTRLSGGNQQKVSVARWMARRPTCLLLEEPTQGVDIGARAEIWTLIRSAVDAGACALVVTSDFQELATHCHRVIVYARGQYVTTLSGDSLTLPAIAEVVHHA